MNSALIDTFDPDRSYAFVGDIHGQAKTLLALLDKLGWKQRDGRLRPDAGQFLVFVGDLIDRGPENLRTVAIVRRLVEQGDAVCLMGNHEFNAVHFHTEHPEKPGNYLREQSEKNRRQHQAVLAELENRPGDRHDMIEWFKTLPLALEGPGWRCVHACWEARSLEVLARREQAWFLPETQWVAAATAGTREYRACETLLKGPEFELPNGSHFVDKDGNPRRHARIAWWASRPQTLKEALLFQSHPEGLDVNQAYENSTHPAYAEDAPPVFFGHYWKPPGQIQPERHNAVCLDYSAGKGGDLVAYRMERAGPIDAGNFVVQEIVQ